MATMGIGVPEAVPRRGRSGHGKKIMGDIHYASIVQQVLLAVRRIYRRHAHASWRL